jgi:hypothetical protein
MSTFGSSAKPVAAPGAKSPGKVRITAEQKKQIAVVAVAAVVVEDTFRSTHQWHAPLEPIGSVAEYKAGKLTPQQWQETMAVLWLGKQFKRIDRYNSLGNLDKKIYLDELINDEIRDDIEDAAKPKGTLKRDKEKAQRVVARFPEAVRVDYEKFRHALKQREKEREKEAKAAKKAAKAAATRPTTRVQGETSLPEK